jgi:hypothetical protein
MVLSIMPSIQDRFRASVLHTLEKEDVAHNVTASGACVSKDSAENTCECHFYRWLIVSNLVLALALNLTQQSQASIK